MDSDWAKLPKHLLDLVIEKLDSSFDYLQFGVVCLKWNSMLKDSQIQRYKISQHHHIPMLLIPGEENTWRIYNTMDNKFSNLKLLIPHNRRFSSSSQGWLVAVNEDYTVTLYKPYAMVDEGNSADFSIHLPCLFPPYLEDGFDSYNNTTDFSEIFDFHIERSVLTADPLINPNECTVVVIFGDMELAMFRIAEDTTWTKIKAPDPDTEDKMLCMHDILQHNNQIYVLISSDGELVSFDVTNSSNPIVKLVAPGIPPKRIRRCEVERYLVESHEGELLQVERYMKWRKKDESRETKMFRIFRLDFDATKWIEIESLGGDSLFLGDNSSISVLASNFTGCQPNSIYFTHDLDNTNLLGQNPIICDVGIYNVESKNFNFHYKIDPNVLKKMNRRPPIWAVPTLSL